MPHWEACGRITLGWSITGRGRPSDGAEIIRAGIEALLSVGTRTATSFWRSALVEAERARGNIDEANALLDELMEFVEDSDERCFEAELVRLQGELTLAEAESDSKTRERAASSFERARNIAQAQGAKPLADRAEASLAHIKQ